MLGIPEGLPSGECITESLMETRMFVVARRRSRHGRARRLADRSDAHWEHTGTSAQTGYTSRLFESHGPPPPSVGVMVNSTLAGMALLGSGDLPGLMPDQIVAHPLGQDIVRVPLHVPG